MLTLLLLWLHILSMFSAVTLTMGSSALLLLAERSGQTAVVRGVGFAGRMNGAIGSLLFFLGGFFGLLTAINFGFNLLAPWLLIAYALFIVAMVLGFGIHRPFGIRLGNVLATAQDGPISGAVAEVLANPLERVAVIVDVVVIAAIIFDMVVKPFS